MKYFVEQDGKELCIDNPCDLTIPNTVKLLLDKIIKQIQDLNLDNPYSLFDVNKDTLIIQNDIKHIFVYRYVYRRGTVFLALQKSLLNTKLVWYYTKTIHHSAQCFGTSPDIKLIQTLKREYKKNIDIQNNILTAFNLIYS